MYGVRRTKGPVDQKSRNAELYRGDKWWLDLPVSPTVGEGVTNTAVCAPGVTTGW